MKLVLAITAAVGMALLLAGSLYAQSLGEYAREMRKNRKPAAAKVYDNDNLPTAGTISVLGPTPAPVKTGDKEKEQREDQAKAEEQKKNQQQLVAGIAEQHQKIAALEHEIDILNREEQIRAAEYYADAGMQLRNPQLWTKQELQYRADVAAKQQELAAARAKLEAMQEAARKAGIPSSARE